MSVSAGRESSGKAEGFCQVAGSPEVTAGVEESDSTGSGQLSGIPEKTGIEKCQGISVSPAAE